MIDVVGHSPSVEIYPLSRLGLAEIAALYSRAFEGYFVPIRIDASTLEKMIEVHSFDLTASWCVRSTKIDEGLALVSRRGSQSRLASMAVLPAARGRGLGRTLLERVLEDASRRGDVSVRLECVEQNEPALKLYETSGFVTEQRLLGFEADGSRLGGGRISSTRRHEVIEPKAIATEMAEACVDGLPWQLDERCLKRYQGDASAVELDGAKALVAIGNEMISLIALWVRPADRGQGLARRLITHLARSNPGLPWSVPALVPERFAEVFAALGFHRSEISQVEMVRQSS